jgi:hypothetical protein
MTAIGDVMPRYSLEPVFDGEAFGLAPLHSLMALPGDRSRLQSFFRSRTDETHPILRLTVVFRDQLCSGNLPLGALWVAAGVRGRSTKCTNSPDVRPQTFQLHGAETFPSWADHVRSSGGVILERSAPRTMVVDSGLSWLSCMSASSEGVSSWQFLEAGLRDESLLGSVNLRLPRA